MKTILMHENAYARMAGRLRAIGGEVEYVVLSDDGHFRLEGVADPVAQPDPDIVFGNADAWFGPQVRLFFQTIMAGSKLDWFQSAAAGVDNPALAGICQKARIYTTNHTQAEAMAEWALWQALDWVKKGPEHRANQAAGVWKRLDQQEIAGSNWLIVGYGSIGEAVGHRVTAMGGIVTGMKRSGNTAPGADRIVHPDLLMQEIGTADIVLLSLPHTPQTEKMAGEAFFAAMKPGSLFMNLGRGALVDEAALIAALDTGAPDHAAIDVTVDEPLPADSPIWAHPKITLTPHDSSQSHGTLVRADETFLKNLKLYLSGEPLLHVVSKQEI